MNTKLLAFLLLALVMSWPVLASSQPEENTENDTEEVVEEAAEEAVEEAVEESTEPLASGIGWQVIRTVEMGNSGKFVYLVLVEQSRYTDKTIYSSAITRLCSGEEEFCRIRFWSNERFIPEKLSMTTEQYKRLKADHLFNRASGQHRTQYNCSVDPTIVDCTAH